MKIENYLVSFAIAMLLLPFMANADTYTVTSSADTTDPGTLRWAMEESNSNSGHDTIEINVSSVISLSSQLPNISDSFTLEGNGTTIVANGGYEIFFTMGFSGTNSIIKNLIAYNNVTRDGRFLQSWGTSTNSFIVQGCIIGTDCLGVADKGFSIAIELAGSGNIIGGDRSKGEGNIISGNSTGLYTNNSNPNGNTICGNIIGLDITQNIAVPNSTGLVMGSNNFIGLPIAGYENIIAGNSGHGLVLEDANNCIIQNNRIGINSNGTIKKNGSYGINATANDCLFGGNNQLSEGNIISGNGDASGEYGVAINGNNNTICGNVIGLDSNQSAVKSNVIGMSISGIANYIGLPINGYGNIIAGNSSNGIEVGGSFNIVQNNKIGINASGDVFGNGGNGIRLQGDGNLIGVDNCLTDLERNIIAGNTGYAILVEGDGNTIVGNYIGIDETGSNIITNSEGIKVTGIKNVIGGTNSDPSFLKGNIICGNGTNGVLISGMECNGNTVAGNRINVLADSSLAPQSFTTAVEINNYAYGNWIGLKAENNNNLIAQAATGISVSGSDTDYNAILNNSIYSISGTTIFLDGAGANQDKSAPVITYASVTLVAGTSDSVDYIEVFEADKSSGNQGGSLRRVGFTYASGGKWELTPSDVVGREYLSAIATDNENNSSAFADNMLVVDVFLNQIIPNYSCTNTVVDVVLIGERFEDPVGIKLSRSGCSDIIASNVNVISSNRIACRFNLNGVLAGRYDIEVIQTQSSETYSNAFLVLQQENGYLAWNLTDIGQGGLSNSEEKWRGICVGDGDNDGLFEIFTAGLLQKIMKFDYENDDWTVSSLPEAAVGEYYTSTVIYNSDHDRLNEVFGTRLDHKLLEFSGSIWQEDDLDGQGSLASDIYHAACGDGNNDGQLEIYVACENGKIYQFKKSDSWIKTEIGQSEESEIFNAVEVGDGNNDGVVEVYAACENGKIYQFRFDGTNWVRGIVGFGNESMVTVVVDDGNNDDENEIFGTNADGNVYQFKWTNDVFYNKQSIATGQINGLCISDGNNDGVIEIYCAAEDGHVYSLEFENNIWDKCDLGSVSTPLYSITVGDGNNDNQHEIYVIGENNHLYQLKAQSASVPTPTPLALDGFDGKIISKKYTYTAPNPVRGHNANFTIVVRQTCELEVKVFTASNKFVMSFNMDCPAQGKYQRQLNMANLANGVYMFFVKAKNRNGDVERLIKKIALIK